MKTLDQIWRAKLKALTATMGVAGEAVYNEIEDAVDARIDEVRENAEFAGREAEFWQNNPL